MGLLHCEPLQYRKLAIVLVMKLPLDISKKKEGSWFGTAARIHDPLLF